MSFLILLFAIAIGAATFIENDYGTPAAKSLVYNAKWFELIIVLLTLNLIGNIFRYKLYRKHKWPVFLFHFSFILIIIGAVITRYISYEGQMHIREGEQSNLIISDDTYFTFIVDDEKNQYRFSKKVFWSGFYNQKLEKEIDFKGNTVGFKFKNFIPNVIDSLVEDENGETYLEIVTAGESGRVSHYIKKGETKRFGNLIIGFEDTSYPLAMHVFETDSGLFFKAPFNISYMAMADQSTGVLKQDSIQPFKNRRLYTALGVQFVLKKLHPKAKLQYFSTNIKTADGLNAAIFDVWVNDKKQEAVIFGGKGRVPEPKQFSLNGLNFRLSFGAIYYSTPFYIQLDDFILERYPGSMSPSSYSSHVTLIDPRNNTKFPYHIYMNHILDYDGYRFFQSSYDQDEMGTVLSVNHDYWGTLITYIGYTLMAIGMFWTLFAKKTRFNYLNTKLKELRIKKSLMIWVALVSVSTVTAQNNHTADTLAKYSIIPETHAQKFGKLLVQDPKGRIKPIFSLASEITRKVTRKNTFNKLSPDQLLLGMLYNPYYYQAIPMIKITHPALKEKLGLKESDKYAPFLAFFDKEFHYLLAKDIEEANRKKPSMRNKYDKEIIQVDERVNICYMVYNAQMLRIFPLPNDKNHTWYSPTDTKAPFTGTDSLFVHSIFPLYFAAITEGFETGNWQKADSTLNFIFKYQERYGKEVFPPENKITAEIWYHKLAIFDRLILVYLLSGILMLIVLILQILNNRPVYQKIVKFFTYILIIGFIAHTFGLILRWYVAGHAPWSNAYESVVYIAWATLLSGFIFSKKSKMTLAATAVLSAILLFVAYLNWLDPEISNLVPVLKSYWLMIHVAVITASYGFLALGAVLGFINLLLMIIKTEKTAEKINLTIKELTYISELTLTVGLFMVTIGTFLGGVWANESWGRYWGWDPKETWALVIVLVYSFVAHMRLIPALKGFYTYNLVSLWAYSSVIMTYFGVNFYLSGLHSYAKGDPVPIPDWVYYTVAVFIILSIFAFIKNKKLPVK
jgi:cytochrome c-type biogenesis protein CcsB